MFIRDSICTPRCSSVGKMWRVVLFVLFISVMSTQTQAQLRIVKMPRFKAFYELEEHKEAFGPHFVDFGAQTGDDGAFSWHATYPELKRNRQSQ